LHRLILTGSVGGTAGARVAALTEAMEATDAMVATNNSEAFIFLVLPNPWTAHAVHAGIVAPEGEWKCIAM
jgi:hypothetical protein